MTIFHGYIYPQEYLDCGLGCINKIGFLPMMVLDFFSELWSSIFFLVWPLLSFKIDLNWNLSVGYVSMYNTYQLSNWHFFYHGFAKEHYIKYNIINSSFKRCVRVVTRILLSTYFCLQLILFENVFVDNFFFFQF